MRATELKKYKRLLLERREKLTGAVVSMQAEALKPGSAGQDVDEIADAGSDQFEQDMTLGLIEREQGEIGSIDEALERIDGGSFGTCEDCEAKIPKARLDIIPMARCCVECQAKKERFGV